MAKFKPAGSKKPKAEPPKRGFIPCIVLLVLAFVLVSVLIFAVMRSGG